MSTANAVEEHAWKAQQDAGIALIGLDGTHYDQVLDTSLALSLAPPRFGKFSGLQKYFAIARGAEGVDAQDMSKFLNTNYHYLVRTPATFAACYGRTHPPLLLLSPAPLPCNVGKTGIVVRGWFRTRCWLCSPPQQMKPIRNE